MIKHVPRGLYDEALETYEAIRPMTLTARGATYQVSESDWRHLLEMARCHLEAQVAGGINEDGHLTRCKRYLRQLGRITATANEGEKP